MGKNFVIVEDDVSKEGHEDENLDAKQEVVLVGNIHMAHYLGLDKYPHCQNIDLAKLDLVCNAPDHSSLVLTHPA